MFAHHVVWSLRDMYSIADGIRLVFAGFFEVSEAYIAFDVTTDLQRCKFMFVFMVVLDHIGRSLFENC